MSNSSMYSMDPVFVKAYKLLFSNDPDSAEQLRCMLDHAIKQRYGSSKSLLSVLPSTPILDTPPAVEVGSKPAVEVGSKPAVEVGFKPAVEVGSKPATQIPIDVVSESEESAHDEDEDLALDLLQEELNCVVCKQIYVGPKNILVECLECHSLYHQECHSPPITDADTSDPRLAWYCATCKKKMDKTLATITGTTVTSLISKSLVGTSSKKLSKKPSLSSSVPSSHSTSLDSSVSRSMTRSAKSAAGKTITPIFTIIYADQRLQQMKKKAAAAKKGHDKGKLSK